MECHILNDITVLHVVKLTNYSKACLCYWMLCC